MTTLASFYALAAQVSTAYRRWAVGAAYSLYERVGWGESITSARNRIMSLPQYSTALVAAGLDDDFALIDTMASTGLLAATSLSANTSLIAEGIA